MSSRGGVHLHSVAEKELFQQFAGIDQAVAIAALAPELEGVLARGLGTGTATRDLGLTLEVRGDSNLQITLDMLDQSNELGRVAESRQVRVGWDRHIGFERNVILNGLRPNAM